VILIHHSGKDEERGARGSSSLRAAMDTEIEVTGGETCSFAHVTKQRDGDDTDAVTFRLVSVPFFANPAESSAVVEHVPRPPRERKSRASDGQALAVERLQAMSAIYPNGLQLEVLVAEVLKVRPDMRGDNVKRSITRAIDGGLLTIDTAHNVRLRAANGAHGRPPISPPEALR
jgi:hypothetical protein